MIKGSTAVRCEWGGRAAFLLVVAVLGVFLVPSPANAQGCIIARSSEQLMGPESAAGYLAAVEWDLTVGFRHQYSFRHFVGPTEQTYRIQQGTQVMNKINLLDYNLTYTISPRWSVSVDAPLLLA